MVWKAFSVAAFAAGSLALAACGGQDSEETTPDPQTAETDNDTGGDGADESETSGGTDTTPDDSGVDLAEVIHFEFDSSTLSDDARDKLERNAEWMREDEARELTIEGHTDQVGTPEYNLALGERRAQSAKEFLVQLGIDEDRIDIVTYGEERPASDVDAENRRSVFVAPDS